MANKKSRLSRYLRFGGSSRSDANGHTVFKFQELAAATRNLAPESLLGEGGYGRSYRGCLKRSGQVVAIRQVSETSISNIYRYNDEQTMFSTIRMCSLLDHPNIAEMIEYCINAHDKDQIFLVYDFMPLGSLKDHLHGKKLLDWNTRMKIAAGAAKGLKCLHDKSDPPVIHGNIKPSNILLCEGYHPKLSDFLGFKERIPETDESSHQRCFGHHCYRHAPEYYMDFKLTQQSDIYSFGFAKRELVGGNEFTTVADPLMKGHYPEQGLYQALFLAAECLQTGDVARPRIGYVVNVLSNLASEIYNPNAIQINRAGALTIGNVEKERLRDQWRHVWSTVLFCTGRSLY
ncbi:receptor-like cytoplasmic kinase 185 [Papaver somniferum]|uniref:receptor-like cytoplasmic kinase 185 n=1 Tax=Papaver somniferum TaxID=3469 RepID=UPI000E6F8635|nr:receptor-like cytoplasmic kinase 185 [Papaver somniferum]